jgi:PAS domain S-box-containing protein
MENERIASVREKISLDLKYLPAFAKFILHQELEQFAKELVRLYVYNDIPLLRFFKSIGEEQRLALVTGSSREMLTMLSTNQANQYINQTVHNWLNNQLPMITREQVQSQDITLVNYIRGQVFRAFIPHYTQDLQAALNLVEELQQYIVVLDSELFSAYMGLQEQQIKNINTGLRESEKLHKQAQALTHIGNWSWIVNEQKITWSDEMYRIFGLSPQSEEITFERFLSFIHPDDKDNRLAEIQSSLQTLTVSEYHFRIKTADGVEKILVGKGEVVADPQGKPHMMLGTCQDMTREFRLSHELSQREQYLEKLNQSLQHANQELSRTNEELESFNFIASHDLQEPLRKIQVYSNRILENGVSQLPPPLQDYFSRINKASSRMQRLIDDFLSFSQTFSHSQGAEDIDMNKMLEEIRMELGTRIEEKQAQLTVTELPSVYGVPFQIKQLMTNLISNALKYTHDGVAPQIMISGSIEPGSNILEEGADPKISYTKISVADKGIGFEEKYRTKIFELFQRLHSKNAYSGTGIGLALCKKIVQNMSGFITAKSELGRGSVFTFYLPLKSDKN